MKNQLAELADHRSKILKRIEAQRTDVSDTAMQLQKPIKYFDAGLIAAKFVYRHPTLIAGSTAAILAFWSKGVPGIKSIIPPILRFVLDRILLSSRTKKIPPSESDSNDFN
jgi:hypothetical protein